MIRSVLLLPAVCAALLAGCGGSAGSVRTPLLTEGEDSFSTPGTLDLYDRVAQGEPGTWSVGSGRLTASGPAIQSLLVRKEPGFYDGFVEAVSPRADDGGLVLRFTSEGSYYLLAFRDDAAPDPRGRFNLAIYRRQGGQFRELARSDIRWPRGTPRAIRFGIAGDALRVYVDGALVGEVTDPEPLPPGRVGIRHYGDGKTWITVFDAFRWQEAE